MGETSPLVSRTLNTGGPNDPNVSSKDIFYDAFPEHIHEAKNLRDTVRASWVSGHVLGEEANFANAMFLLRDAFIFSTKTVIMDHGGFNPFMYDENSWMSKVSLYCRDVLMWKNEMWKKLAFWIGSFGLIVLSFIEPPSWCLDESFILKVTSNGHTDTYTQAQGHVCTRALEYSGPPLNGNQSDVVQYYPNSGLKVFTHKDTLLVMEFFLSLVIIELFLHFGKNGFSWKNFFYLESSSGMNAINRMASSNLALSKKYTYMARTVRFVQVLSVVMLLAEIMLWSRFYWLKRWSPLWRALVFASYAEGVQQELMNIFRLIPGLFSALFVLFVVDFFYAWVGVIAFSGTLETFDTLPEAMWTLWICVTTANYPDVMMSAYNSDKFVAFYFVSFMIVTYFFLMNVILALVVNSYKEENDSIKAAMEKLSNRYMKKAYRLLAKDCEGNDRLIDRGVIEKVFKRLNDDFSDMGRIPKEKTDEMFAMLDADNSGSISEKEFMEFGTVLRHKFKEVSGSTTFVQEKFPSIYSSEQFQEFSKQVMSSKFETFVDIILLLNAIVVAIQSYPIVSGSDPDLREEVTGPLEQVETCFTVFYCVELICKLLVYGWNEYMSKARNVFDATVTMLVLLATVIVYYPNNYSNHYLIRLAVMMRVLRLFRLLGIFEQFNLIGNTLTHILPAARRITVFLFFVMYLVVSLGLSFFGGLITRDPSNPLTPRLQETAFGSADYWSNNFNDYPLGFNTLFNLLVVNNWINMAAGLEVVSGHKWLTRLFFLSWHMIGVVVVFNIVVAIVIDSFMDQIASKKAETSNEDSHLSLEAQNTGELGIV